MCELTTLNNLGLEGESVSFDCNSTFTLRDVPLWILTPCTRLLGNSGLYSFSRVLWKWLQFFCFVWQFGVVLDGGSSHTALFVYQWPGPKWKGTGVLQQIGVCNIMGIKISAVPLGHDRHNLFLLPPQHRWHCQFFQQRQRGRRLPVPVPFLRQLYSPFSKSSEHAHLLWRDCRIKIIKVSSRSFPSQICLFFLITIVICFFFLVLASRVRRAFCSTRSATDSVGRDSNFILRTWKFCLGWTRPSSVGWQSTPSWWALGLMTARFTSRRDLKVFPHSSNKQKTADLILIGMYLQRRWALWIWVGPALSWRWKYSAANPCPVCWANRTGCGEKMTWATWNCTAATIPSTVRAACVMAFWKSSNATNLCSSSKLMDRNLL